MFVMFVLSRGICVFLFSLNTIKCKINYENRLKCKQGPTSLRSSQHKIMHHKSIQVSKIQYKLLEHAKRIAVVTVDNANDLVQVCIIYLAILVRILFLPVLPLWLTPDFIFPTPKFL